MLDQALVDVISKATIASNREGRTFYVAKNENSSAGYSYFNNPDGKEVVATVSPYLPKINSDLNEIFKSLVPYMYMPVLSSEAKSCLKDATYKISNALDHIPNN